MLHKALLAVMTLLQMYLSFSSLENDGGVIPDTQKRIVGT